MKEVDLRVERLVLVGNLVKKLGYLKEDFG